MTTISFARHQFPPDIIRHAVWLYLRFTLSFRDVEDLLAERGLDISYETVRARSGLIESGGFPKRRESDSSCWLLIGGQLGWLEPILWTCGSGWLGRWRRVSPAVRWPRRLWSASPA